jgi:hypothetical protein
MTVSTGTIIHIYSAVKAVKAPNIVAPPVDSFFHCVSLHFLLDPGSNPPNQCQNNVWIVIPRWLIGSTAGKRDPLYIYVKFS